jgi:hypothetical protein
VQSESDAPQIKKRSHHTGNKKLILLSKIREIGLGNRSSHPEPYGELQHCFLDFPCPKYWRQGGEMDKNIVHKNSCVIQLSNNTASPKQKELYQLLRRRRKCSNKSIGKKKKKKQQISKHQISQKLTTYLKNEK